jgi:hypothetical protein
MNIKLLSASLMLGALVACKKKDNTPNLEKVLEGTTWEAVSFDGNKTASTRLNVIKSWANPTNENTDNLFTYENMKKPEVISNLFEFSHFIGFSFLMLKSTSGIDVAGNKNEIAYNGDGFFMKSDMVPFCETGKYHLDIDFFEDKEADASMIKLMQNEYFAKQLCRTYIQILQYNFQVSADKLLYTGVKQTEYMTMYDKETKRELGKRTTEVIGSWNLEYSKK